MTIWLLENGERTGPHQIYDIRDRISNDELDADTPAWYDGAEDWVTLAEVPAYSSYFKKGNTTEEQDEKEKLTSELIQTLEKELAKSDARPNSPLFKNEPLHPIRRFFARMLDISLYTMLLYIVKVQMGINPLVVESVTKELMFQLPYILLDGLALSYFGTTPGKWFLNIKLRAHDGQRLAAATSLIRSVRVWVLGFAMQSPFILISIPFSWYIATKYGKFIWDIPKNNVTECMPLKPAKIIGYFLVIIAASYILKYSIPPEFMPTMENWKAWNPS